MIGCLWTRVRKQPIIALYFEFENELSFITSGPAYVLGPLSARPAKRHFNGVDSGRLFYFIFHLFIQYLSPILTVPV